MTLNTNIAIIGAGLGGLSCAITLRQLGLCVDVFEAAETIEETGAGLTLGLGAQHVFRALNLQKEVAALACPAGQLPFMHYRSAEILMGERDDGDGLPDDGASNIIRHIYRADLQRVLLAAFADLGGAVYTGKRMTSYTQDETTATAHFSDATQASANIMIGADGVRSVIRAQMVPRDRPRFTDHIAYRCLVPMEQAKPFMGLGRSAILIGPGRSFNRYTMAKGQIVNLAALVETSEEVPEGWSTAAPQEEVLQAFADWHPDVTGLISQAGASIKWGLYDRAPLKTWSDGRVTMLGDAAHAMLPFLGMGAAMAIEDGYVLAQMLAQHDAVADALTAYEAMRIERTRHAHEASKLQGQITQSIDVDNFSLMQAPVNNQDLMAFDPTTPFI